MIGVKLLAQLALMATFVLKNLSSILQNKVAQEDHIVLLVFSIYVQLVIMALWNEVLLKHKPVLNVLQDTIV